MKAQELFFGSNIKFLRERKKLSQESLAETLSMTRSKLNALENGQTKAPQPEDYLKFSDYFKISMDSLLKVNLSKLSELQLRELEAGNDVYMTGRQIRVLAITVNSENQENVEYVPVKAKAGYRDGYTDPAFIATLPKFSLPNLPAGATFRMFPIIGDSMLPIPDGSDIVAQFVDDWTTLRPETPCILILKGEQDFVFKLVTLLRTGGLLLRSMNPVYEPYTVEAHEVLEVWKYHSFISKDIPVSETSMEQLLRMVLALQREVRQMKVEGSFGGDQPR